MKALILWIMLPAFLGGYLAQALTASPAPEPLAAEKPSLSLPPLPDTQAREAAYRQLRQTAAQSTGPSGTKTAADWTLKGIVRHGARRYALIESDQKLDTYEAGAALPGGGAITAVEPSRILLQLDQRTTSESLYAGPES